MSITVKRGVVSGSIGPELQRIIARIVNDVNRETVNELEKIVEPVAVSSAAQWYDQVEYRDGSTGQIDYELVISGTTIRARVVSGDRAAYMVRRPGPTSVRTRKLTDAEYAAAMRDYRRTGKLPPAVDVYAYRDGRPTMIRKIELNPKRSDGKNLWQELVNKPLRKYVREAGPALQRALTAVARRATNG